MQPAEPIWHALIPQWLLCCPLPVRAAFAAAANAVTNTTLDPPFSPYTNYLYFLHGGEPGAEDAIVCAQHPVHAWPVNLGLTRTETCAAPPPHPNPLPLLLCYSLHL